MRNKWFVVEAANQDIAPTVAMTCSQTSPTITNPVNVTITFSEQVTGFAVGDIVITAGGSLSSFATADNIIYTVNWTLANGGNAMEINAGVCTDLAGNPNTAATPFVMERYLAYDTLTDADATALASHTMEIGAGWVEAAGTWVVATNKASQTNANIQAFCVTNVSEADVIASLDLDLTNAALWSMGMAVRYQDTTHTWTVLISKDAATPVLQIVERNPSNTVRASLTLTSITLPCTVTMTVTTTGNTIAVTLSGGFTASLSFESAVFANNTKFGMQHFRNASYSAILMDNFKVRSQINP